MRIIDQAEPQAHTDPLFHAYGCLKVKDIYWLRLGIFMFQFHNNDLPYFFQSMFTTNNQIHSYNTRQSTNINIPLLRTAHAQKFIGFQGPTFWNSLGSKFTHLKSHALFQKKIKSALLHDYSYS